MTLFKKAASATKGLTSIFDMEKDNDEMVNDVKEESIEEKVMKFGQNRDGGLDLQTEDVVRSDRYEGNEAVVNRNSRLRIYKPTYYEVVQSIGRDIREGKIVLLDMSSLDEKTTVKILQFVYGICFALDVEPEDVSPKIISIDPQNKARR